MKLQISDTIRSLRKEHGMMQEQLAEALGVSTAAVSKWERGTATPELGYIVKMADLFGVSIDVLVGYQVQKGTVNELEERINKLQRDKEFEQAVLEAEKALTKYPNHFSIVYCCGKTYQLKGIDTQDLPSIERAVELLKHAILLLSQNTNPEVDEYTIQADIAQCYLCLGKEEQGLELLKKYNTYGIHDALIGMTYSYKESYRVQEAEPYLVKAFSNCLTILIRAMMGYINYYKRIEDYASAIDAALWLVAYLESIKIDKAEISYVDKIFGPLYAKCALLSMKLGQAKEAEAYLRKALKTAKGFDTNPVYGVENIRFCVGDTEQLTAYDDIGTSVVAAIEEQLQQEQGSEQLLVLWEEWKQNYD